MRRNLLIALAAILAVAAFATAHLTLGNPLGLSRVRALAQQPGRGPLAMQDQRQIDLCPRLAVSAAGIEPEQVAAHDPNPANARSLSRLNVTQASGSNHTCRASPSNPFQPATTPGLTKMNQP